MSVGASSRAETMASRILAKAAFLSASGVPFLDIARRTEREGRGVVDRAEFKSADKDDHGNLHNVQTKVQKTSTESSTSCPSGFPKLERHSESNHGDVCRNDNIHGYNDGWTCPAGCSSVSTNGQIGPPWCSLKDPHEPCRIEAFPCVGGPKFGDGLGNGYSEKVGDGSADNLSHCIEMVKTKQPRANGATLGSQHHNFECFAIFYQTGIMPDDEWTNCLFPPVSECPAGFPDLERHTEINHGDVCRNGTVGGFNKSWACPAGCSHVANTVGWIGPPWCSPGDPSPADPWMPCRAGEFDCVGGVQFGDGLGEKDVLVRNTTGSLAECIEIVKEEQQGANGATFGSPYWDGQCHAVFGQYSVHSDTHWRNCRFPSADGGGTKANPSSHW